MDVDGSAGRGGRLPAEIQSGEAAQPAGLREPGGFCGAELSSPSSGRAAPSLRRGWTKNKQKHKLNHVPGLTHGLDQKSEPGQSGAKTGRPQGSSRPAPTKEPVKWSWTICPLRPTLCSQTFAK